MSADGELRGFVARLLGWTCERAVDQALASIALATARRAHLVLCGAGDLVPIAYALHRRTLGTHRPFVVCDRRRGKLDPLLVVPAPLRLPSLRDRADEMPRIIDEYARDALAELGARETSFTDRERAWVLAHAATSLSEIGKTTLRLVALRASANVSNAAARLGMAPVSLSKWISRWRLGRVLAAT